MCLNIFTVILLFIMLSNHRKVSPADRAAHERAVLRLVQGSGVVPTPHPPAQAADPIDPTVVETVACDGSLADVLAERGRLTESECREIGSRIATALAAVHERGMVHGDVKPANVLMAPEGDVWIADFDAAGPVLSPRTRGTPQRLVNHATLEFSDDIVGVALLVAECATGVVIDPTVDWSAAALAQLGCSRELAADLAAVLADPIDLCRAAALLGRTDSRLPSAADTRAGKDPTPTIDFEPTVISGLDPLPTTAEALNQPQTPSGWRDSIRGTLQDWALRLRTTRSELTTLLRGRQRPSEV